MAIKAGDAILFVSANTQGLKKGLKAVGSVVRTLTSPLALLTGALGVAGLSGALALTVKTAADFEQAIRNAAVVTGKTGDALDDAERKISKLALTLGENTVFSATQAADALGILARKGFDVASFSVQELQPFLDLAAATMSDLTFATDVATSTLKAFGFANSEVNRIADVFVQAANTSALNMQNLGEAMKFVAPIARAAGVSFEETVAALAQLAEKGTIASIAGTGLRRAFTALIEPQGKFLEILTDIGLTINDVSLKENSFADVLQTLKDAGFTTGNAMQAFGDRAGVVVEQLGEFAEDGKAGKAVKGFKRAVADTGGQMGEFGILAAGIAVSFSEIENETEGAANKLKSFTESLQDVDDKAKETAEKQLETLKGKFTLLTSVIKTTAIKIGNKFLPAVGDLVEAATGIVKEVGLWIDEQDDLQESLQEWVNAMIQKAMPTIEKFGRAIADFVSDADRAVKAFSGTIQFVLDSVFKLREALAVVGIGEGALGPGIELVDRRTAAEKIGPVGVLAAPRTGAGPSPIPAGFSNLPDITPTTTTARTRVSAPSAPALSESERILQQAFDNAARQRDLDQQAIDRARAEFQSFQPRALGGFTSGPTLVGERGPEIVRPPSGSRVFSNAESKAMGGGGNVEININMNGVSGNPNDIANAVENRLLQLIRDRQFNFGALAV